MENKKKSTKVWTADNQLKYTTLFNYMTKKYGVDKVVEDTFINDYKRSLMKEIQDNTKWGASAKENFYFMIKKWLARRDKSDRYVNIYGKKAFELLTENKKNIAENKLDDKEQENYRDYSYFENILNNKDKFGNNIKEHYQYLLLACLIWQPPLRTDFYRSATLLKKLDDNDGKHNYVYINKRGKNNVMFIVNKDKASNYRVYKKNKNLSNIVLEDQRLINLIVESFEKYPRKYLFENPKIKDRYNPQTILKYLRNITGLDGVNDQMMRSIYITHFYSKNPTYGQKHALSLEMRHSAETAAMNYNKVFDKDEEPVGKISDDVVELQKENFKLKEQLQQCQEQTTPKDDTALYNKRRSDILYRYNKKNVSPKEKTLKQYNIKYDTEKKIYY